MYWNKSFLFFRCKVRFCSGILCLVILCIMSCGTEKYVQFVYADLRAFGEQKSASELQFEAFEAGGGGLKREKSIVWHEVTCSWTTSGNDAGWGNLELLNIAPPKSALREKWMAMLQGCNHRKCLFTGSYERTNGAMAPENRKAPAYW